MIGEASFYGIYMPWLLVLVIVALFIAWVLRRLLAVLGIYRWIWHPALFDAAVYVLILFLLTNFSAARPAFL